MTSPASGPVKLVAVVAVVALVAVVAVVALAALPEMLPLIVLENVLVPAMVCGPDKST